MPVFISMLRGVNVGGHNKIKMDALRALYESLGLLSSQTLIQSGNVVFRSKERKAETLCKKIGDGIESTFGFRPSVVVRTTAELRETIAKNPFARRKDTDPRKLLVVFLGAAPAPEVRDKVLAMNTGPEEIRAAGSELYIYFTNGLARPKLSMPALERTLKIASTGRNWNTVQKLLQMAENLEAQR